MIDIYIGMAIMLVISIGCFALALRLGKRLSRKWLYVAALATVAALFAFGSFLMDNIWLSHLLPFSNLIVVGNWLPPLAFFMAGIAWQLIPGRVRRIIYIVPLLGICLYHSYAILFYTTPDCYDFWTRDGICIQTEPASCSAACAATLLKLHGIDATEKEMARLCFTGDWGTSRWGLYRGLKIKTVGTPYNLKIFSSRADLEAPENQPSVIVVGLDRGGTKDPRYENDWGWRRGVKHAVIFLGGADDGMVKMADPSIGREAWGWDSIDVLWRHVGICLVKAED
jgi:hypothetical protein